MNRKFYWCIKGGACEKQASFSAIFVVAHEESRGRRRDGRVLGDIGRARRRPKRHKSDNNEQQAKEDTNQFNAERATAMGVEMQFRKEELEAMGRFFLRRAQQEGLSHMRQLPKQIFRT
jgi:hypothetical protein